MLNAYSDIFHLTLWLQFDEPTLGLSREFLLRGIDDGVVKAYYDYMVDVAVIFGADKERAKKEFLEALQFETSLANVCRKMHILSTFKRFFHRIIRYF